MTTEQYTYTVLGRGTFPFDMLRYDQCYPADQQSAHNISVERMSGAYLEPREVKLHGLRPPTVDRWMSFGWHPANSMVVRKGSTERTVAIIRR